VNAGDFAHHVPVRTRDQLAALAESFNSMTDSITILLEEQKQRQRLESELTIAHEVQEQLFPRYIPRVRGIELSGICLPARVVSGDYYDFIELGDNRLAFALGDIAGKGISAALLMATLASAIRAYQHAEALPAYVAAGSGRYAVAAEAEPLPPSVLVSRLNEQLYRSTTAEKYATLFYGVYDSNRSQLRYTNAGHLPPAVLGRSGRRRLTCGGMVIGLFDNATYDEAAITLELGDLIVAWSDGISEPENDYGEEFGEERLLQVIEENQNRSLDSIAQTVLTQAREWNGTQEQADDVTLLLARVV
jgi:sigma-B regulation protein RsbU (phosphoserine phosphatase)